MSIHNGIGLNLSLSLRPNDVELWTAPTPGDTTPDAFSFTDVTGADVSTVYPSNAITVAGIDTPTDITIDGAGEYRINGGSWVASLGSVANGDQVEVRLTSSASYETPVSTTLTIGGVSDTFTVTTEADPVSTVFPERVTALSTVGAQTTNATSYNVALPASGIQANDYIVIMWAADGSSVGITWDNTTAGTWTVLNGGNPGALINGAVRYKLADGTENGKTLAVTNSNSEKAAWRIEVIRGADPATSPVTGTSNQSSSGAATTANPGAVTLWSEKALVMAMAATDASQNSGRTINAPSNMTAIGSVVDATGTDGALLAAAEAQSEAASFDPSNFSWTGGEEYWSVGFAFKHA